MRDAARPSDEEFTQVLQESLKTWNSYLGARSDDEHLLPRQAINMKSLVSQTPSFLGDNLAPYDETISFACEERESTRGKDSLLVNGRSTWRTSKGTCDLEPRILPRQLLLAVGSRLNVELSEDSPLADWPGVQGLSGYDEGNYLSVLYFAWAYILSARWVELLGRSADHGCHMSYTTNSVESQLSLPDSQSLIQIDIGNDACEDEVFWWRTILRSGNGWNATTKYKDHVYLSPWSISAKKVGYTLTTNGFPGTKSEPPPSDIALKYLSRFCVHHRLYAQCSVALAGVLYVPFLTGREIYLPLPRHASRPELTEHAGDSPVSIPDLLNDHNKILPKYMTLSSNTWGLRSLLCSTFFNPDIECNLVSAWLNPAFAILDSISPNKILLVRLLSNRKPRLGILWLGAILTGLDKTILRDTRVGMTALDLPASAWTKTAQTFLTSRMGTTNGESVRRDDECRLSFITACEGHDRPPIWSWKPFGDTKLCDTDLAVKQHAQCAYVHCLEYECWEWILTDGSSIQDFKKDKNLLPDKITPFAPNIISPALQTYNFDLSSQLLSEVATRGIFSWLRSTGYPHREKPIYQHSWIDLEETDNEEEPDDAESDGENIWARIKTTLKAGLTGSNSVCRKSQSKV